MKWGVRKDRTPKKNPNYTQNQRARDKQVYGSGGVRRVNKKMNKGYTIGTARSSEKTRRDKFLGRNKYARQGGKVVGGAVGGLAGVLAVRGLKSATRTPAVQKIMDQVLGKGSTQMVSNLLRDPRTTAAVAAGSAASAYMLSGDLGVAANMRLGGYNPNRR